MADRKKDGKFAKGHAIQPTAQQRSLGQQRKSKERRDALLDALDEALPPEKCREIIEEAIKIAMNTKSAKALLEILKFKYSYVIGTPVQRTLNTKAATPQEWREMLTGIDHDNPDLIESVEMQDYEIEGGESYSTGEIAELLDREE